MLPLRPYQVEAVERLKKRRRQLLAWSVGAGKSRGAIACAQACDAQKILVVAPAIARPVWVREFQKWTGKRAYPIRWGRRRAGLSKAQEAEREEAYAADIQIVSYALLKDIAAVHKDFIVFDEIHNLRNPLSKQSRMAKHLLRTNFRTPAVGLSGTPMPTELHNIWNPVDTLVPQALGLPTRTGDVSWSFREEFQLKEVNEYGTRYFGAKEGAGEALAQRLAPMLHRVTEADFAKYLPPLSASVLYIDEKRSDVEVAMEWLDERLANGAKRIALIPYLRVTGAALAVEVAKRKLPYTLIDGSLSPEVRAEWLRETAEQESSIVIATSESVREAISLSFIKDVLIMEWRTSPAQATQLLGRFARSDSASRAITRVEYVAHEEDTCRAELLQERLTTVAKALGSDSKGDALRKVFAERVVSESQMELMLEKSLARFNESATEVWDEDT